MFWAYHIDRLLFVWYICLFWTIFAISYALFNKILCWYNSVHMHLVTRIFIKKIDILIPLKFHPYYFCIQYGQRTNCLLLYDFLMIITDSANGVTSFRMKLIEWENVWLCPRNKGRIKKTSHFISFFLDILLILGSFIYSNAFILYFTFKIIYTFGIKIKMEVKY